MSPMTSPGSSPRASSGRSRTLAVSAVRDDDQQIVNFVSVYTDITRIPHAQTQLDRLAHHARRIELGGIDMRKACHDQTRTSEQFWE